MPMKRNDFANEGVRRNSVAPVENYTFRREGTRGAARTKAPRLRLQNAYAVGLRSAVLKRGFGGAVPVPSPPALPASTLICAAPARIGPAAHTSAPRRAA